MSTPFSKDLAEALSDVFVSADALRIAGRDMRPRTVASRESGSQLGLASPCWGPHPVDDALLDVLLRVGTCSDHGRAFSALLGLQEPVPFAVFAAARAHIETSARAYWHLEANSAAQRVGRHLGDLLASNRRYAQATAEMGDAAWLYPDSVAWKGEATRLEIVIETPPGYTDAVGQAFSRTPLRRTGSPVYRMTSGVAHAETWGMWALMEYIDEGAPDSVWEQVHFPLQDAHAAILARHMLAIHRLVLNEYLRVFGKQPDALQNWRRQMVLANRLLSPQLKAIRRASGGRPRTS